MPSEIPLWQLITLAYGGTTAVRLLFCAIGRLCGLYNPNWFYVFLWLPWRPLYRLLLVPRRWWEEMFRTGRRATARWTGVLEALTLVYRPGLIFLGRVRAFGIGLFQPVGVKGERHLVMIAGTGSGKTTQLITMLGLHKGSSFVIDPKGQIAKTIVSRMGQGGEGVIGKKGKVCVLDPYRLVNGWQSSCWNPFDEIDRAIARHGNRDVAVRYAMKFAEGLIIQYPRENPFWPGTAKDFLLALILHIHTTEPPQQRTLARLYDMLTNGIPERTEPGKSAFGAMLREMSRNQAFGGVIAASANTLADTGNDTFGNVLITMREQLKWLKLPEIRTLCQRSDFHLEEMKTGTLNLFICAPVGDIRGALAGYFRLISVLSFYVFENIPGRLKHPCLFALDEMPSLGNIEAVATAAPVMRSYGVRLLAIAQDLEKLKAVYPDAWGGFIGNAEAVFWMGLEHQETLSYLSQRLGQRTFRERVIKGGAIMDHETPLERRFVAVEK
jgi:type IV secretory pathway TraG/TraD family ATPase VirD4